MSYAVEITTGALRQLQKLPVDIQKRVATKIDALAENPRLEGVVKLSGSEDAYRIRVGDYRIIYRIQDDMLLVTVLRIAHRSEAYR